MRVFRSIVEPFVLTMLHSWQNFTFRSLITLQLISDDHARNVAQPFEQLTEKSLRGLFIAMALYQDIEHIPVLIHRSP